jgi:hypothetical protein
LTAPYKRISKEQGELMFAKLKKLKKLTIIEKNRAPRKISLTLNLVTNGRV